MLVVPLFDLLPYGSRTISSWSIQSDALFPRASPLKKQSTGLFFWFTPCRGIQAMRFRTLRSATRALPSTCKPFQRLERNFYSLKRPINSSLRLQRHAALWKGGRNFFNTTAPLIFIFYLSRSQLFRRAAGAATRQRDAGPATRWCRFTTLRS